MTEQSNTTFRHRFLGTFIVRLLPVADDLSDAPAAKLTGSWTVESGPNFNRRLQRVKAPPGGTASLPIDRPVDRLIDDTPLDRAPFAWASAWEADPVFLEAVLGRSPL